MKYKECEKDFDNLREEQQIIIMSQLSAFKILNSYDFNTSPPAPPANPRMPARPAPARQEQLPDLREIGKIPFQNIVGYKG